MLHKQFGIPVTIAGGQSASDAIELSDRTPLGVQLPAAWTAANLTFSVSFNNVDFVDLYSLTGEVNATAAAAGRHIILDPADFVGVGWLILRSGTTGTPVAQAGKRNLILITRDV